MSVSTARPPAIAVPLPAEGRADAQACSGRRSVYDVVPPVTIVGTAVVIDVTNRSRRAVPRIPTWPHRTAH
jgi:hypothetical protein